MTVTFADVITALQDLAAHAPIGATLVKNDVGNLAICDSDGNFIGYVDLTIPADSMLEGSDGMTDATGPITTEHIPQVIHGTANLQATSAATDEPDDEEPKE